MEISKYGNPDPFNDYVPPQPRTFSESTATAKPATKKERKALKKDFEKHSLLVESILHSQKMDRLSR